MKKLFDRKPLWVRDKKRLSYSESQPQLERLRTLSQWLLIIPVVMLILFSCGQIGILTSQKLAEANTQSDMEADYGPWSYVLIHSIKPEIIEEIVRDKQNEVGEDDTIPDKSESDKPWLNAIPNPTSVARLDPTLTFTPIPNQENQPLPTEPLVASATPTQVPSNPPISTVTQPATPIPSSPIPSSTPAPTTPPPPTHTSVSTIANTYWFANTRVPGGYALSPNQPNGISVDGGIYLKFFTDPIPDGATMEGGKCILSFYASNTSSNDQEIGIVLSADTSGWPALGGTTKSIPANTTTPTYFTKSFSILSHIFSQSERLTLTFSLTTFVTLYWDGEWNDASLVIPPIIP